MGGWQVGQRTSLALCSASKQAPPLVHRVSFFRDCLPGCKCCVDWNSSVPWPLQPLTSNWLLSWPAHIRSWAPTKSPLEVPRVGAPPHRHACGPCSASVPLPSSWKPAWESLALPTWDPSVPIFLHSHCCQVVWSYSTGCRVPRILNSPVRHCEPCFVLGTHMPAARILRFMVSHTRQFLQSLPAALHTLPLIRGQHESPTTHRAPVQFSSCVLTPSASPQLTRPAWTRLLSVRAQGRTPTVGIHWVFLVNMLFCF